MDFLFLDTSVFVSENFLEGKKIREIYRLAYDNELKLILPRITYNEIISRIRISTKEAIIAFKSFRDKARVLRNTPDMGEKFSNIRENIAVDIELIFQERIADLQTIIIEYPIMNIGEVFDKYFANEFPFSTGEKKSEFPDAFALATLEKWCTESGKKCLVIAGDKDISQYKASANLKVVNTIDEYLNGILKRIATRNKRRERIQRAINLFEKKRPVLENQIKSWLTDQLENDQIYYQYDPSEILSIKINSADVELNYDPQITSTSEMNILLTSYASISIDVTLVLENDEDHMPEWDFQNEAEIYKDLKISIGFEVDIPLAGDQFMDIKVIEINSNNQLNVY